MYRTLSVFAASLALLVFVGAGCSPAQENADNDAMMEGDAMTTDEPIKIGMSAPLTGEAASFGAAMQAGAELAVSEINKAGGVDGRMIEIVYEDDKCGKDGLSVFTKLVNVDNVSAIVGPLCSAAAGPGVPVAQEAGVPVILTGASAPDLTAVGDYIFRYYPSDSIQGEYAAELLYNEFAKRKVAVVYVQNDWGLGLADVFEQSFKNLGGEVVLKEGVVQDSKDLRSILTKLKAAQPDAVYLATYPAAGIVATKQMKELGIDLPIVAGDAMSSEEVADSGQADGIVITVGRVNEPEDFAERVKAETGKEPTWVSPLTYDAVYMLSEVMHDVGSDRAAIRDALSKIRYEGLAFDVAQFDERGELREVAFDLKTIVNGDVTDYKL